MDERDDGPYVRVSGPQDIDEKIQHRIEVTLYDLCRFCNSPCQTDPFLDLFDENDIEIHSEKSGINHCLKCRGTLWK